MVCGWLVWGGVACVSLLALVEGFGVAGFSTSCVCMFAASFTEGRCDWM